MFGRSKVPLEDWDFRDCTMGETGFGCERDAFFSEHFLEVMAVSSRRLEVMDLLIEDGWFAVDESGKFASMSSGPRSGASFLKGMAGNAPTKVARKALK